MKKILAFVMCVVLMFALAIPAAAVVNLTANRTDVAIILDGVRDDIYSGPFDIATPVRDEYGDFLNAPGAATGQVWAAWNAEALYLYFEIDDRTPHHDDFNAECIEIFIDWNAGLLEADEGSDDSPYWQIRVSPVDPTELGGYSRDGNGPNWSTMDFENYVEWVLLPIDGSFDNGYIVEMRIAVPAFSSLYEGKVIPVDFQVCDNTQGEGRDGQMFLAHIGEGIHDNDRWNTSAFFMGRLALGGTPEVAADEEPEAEEAPEYTPAPITDTAAPPTADPIMIIVLGSLISAAGVAIAKKRK